MSIVAGAPGWGAWSADPGVIGAVLLGAAGFVGCYRRLTRRTGRRYAGHVLAFAGGLCIVVVALLSPVDDLGDRWLLSAHMLQHVLLADIAPALLVLGLRPPLIALGLPAALLRALSPRARLGRLLRHRLLAPIALGLWAAAQWGWSVPSAFDFAAAHPLVHTVEHLSLLGSGLLLWTVVIDPLPGSHRRALWSRLGYLGASRAISAVVCLPLTWIGTTLYPRYAVGPRAYGLSALTDQHIAGAAMCLTEFFVFGIAFIVVFLDLLARDEKVTSLADRASRSAPDTTARHPVNAR
jgi:putative membrane protein